MGVLGPGSSFGNQGRDFRDPARDLKVWLRRLLCQTSNPGRAAPGCAQARLTEKVGNFSGGSPNDPRPILEPWGPHHGPTPILELWGLQSRTLAPKPRTLACCRQRRVAEVMNLTPKLGTLVSNHGTLAPEPRSPGPKPRTPTLKVQTQTLNPRTPTPKRRTRT